MKHLTRSTQQVELHCRVKGEIDMVKSSYAWT